MIRQPDTHTREGRIMRPLTPRELQVAALLSAGLQNKEIAAQLKTSPATVANQVSVILRKLRYTSRHELRCA